MDRIEQCEWLRKEVSKWKSEGLIDDRLAQAILSRYDQDYETITEERSSRLISVVSILGAVLVGVGAILFVASNWNAIPEHLRFLLLFGATFGTYFIGWNLRFRRGPRPKAGHALLFLASIFVGATIFLTAQTFNVNANEDWLILLWFLAISPLGYGFNSKPILGLNIFTFVLWIGFYLSISQIQTIFSFYLLLGIGLYGLGHLHIISLKYSRFRGVYQDVGLFLILTSYLYFSFGALHSNETLYRSEIAEGSWPLKLLFIIFILAAIGSILISSLWKEKFKAVKPEFFVLLMAFMGWILTASLILFWQNLAVTTTTDYGYNYTRLNPDLETPLFIFYNLMILVLSLGSILIGYYRSVVSFVNVGLLFFVIGVLHIYFTTVYAYLPRSLALIVGGLILLVGGWRLEKVRRSLIKKMDLETTKEESKKAIEERKFGGDG